jgi:hypothetical protein
LVRLCDVGGCEKKHKCKGYCDKHYRKFRIFGNALYVADPKEMSRRMSESAKKRPPISESTRKKLSEVHKGKLNPSYGRIVPKSIRKKMSESAKKRPPISESTRKKLSESGKKRPPISESTRKKLSELSKRENLSDITRKKMSESKKLQVVSTVTRKKISKTLTGRIVPESTRKKLSESLKGRISPMKGRIQSELSRKKASESNSTPENKQKSRERLQRTRHDQQKPNKKELTIKKILMDKGLVFNPEQDLKKFTKSSTKSNFGMFINIPFSHKQLEQKYKEVDFLISPNKIIEHNGTYDHADPRKHKSGDKIRKTTAQTIWKKEKSILDSLKKEGYSILVVWQLDLDKDTENTTEKILKFAKS